MELLDDDLISVRAVEYIDLVNSSLLLECLRNAGVENWEGWEIAMEEFSEMESK